MRLHETRFVVARRYGDPSLRLLLVSRKEFLRRHMRPTFLPYPYQANEGDYVKQYKPNQGKGELEVHGSVAAETDHGMIGTEEHAREKIEQNEDTTPEEAGERGGGLHDDSLVWGEVWREEGELAEEVRQ